MTAKRFAPLEESLIERKSRTLAVLQPGYLPWLGFFHQMAMSDIFVLYDDVQYDKNGWRNRNRIKTPSGAHWLSVPVKVRNLGQKILDVEIDNRTNWSKKHLGTIRQFYAKSSYFGDYFPAVEEILNRPWEFIVDLDVALIEQFKEWLDIKAELCRSSELSVAGGKTERLVNFCRHFEATRYFSGAAAKDYLVTDLFQEHGITVEWQDYQHPVYSQGDGEFLPFLSALDLLMHNGSRSGEILRADASFSRNPHE